MCFCQEKAPFEAKAAKRKADYEKVMKAYNKKQVPSLLVHLVLNACIKNMNELKCFFAFCWTKIPF